MKVEHLAVDGSVVAIEAEADLNTRATAAGWAIVPSLMRAHPFTITPAGHSRAVEEAVRTRTESVRILSTKEFRVKNGTLRIAEVGVPGIPGGARELTVGAWEGDGGCLSSSLRGRETNRLAEVFDTLAFAPHQKGLAIDSPIMAQPRAPEVIKEIPNVGVLAVRPAVASELERVPRARGFATDSGELFRLRKGSNALLYLSRSAMATVNPFRGAQEKEILAVAQKLRVEWIPRASGGR